ncbi:ABC transporter permease [Devosia sp. XJ19-1]|uniref:ABC transporter permease n=1 Tax=Devosia ureilytica TaxID=2952754 RepID=A0A9Q4FRI7_9HYPH|nr:ABC transporter permease [Devosia ureilytica]MCP8883379.1 ABC transporter permease [Devosia ureilytica]MCP8886253.1 ABC transporter permease [Devosia ureilytica]
MESLKGAFDDVGSGLRMRRIWMALAQEDIGDQHRRTRLGPLWLLISYLAFAGTFIFVFQRGDSGAQNYPAYVATGLLVWLYIMETINQSITLFAREESFIKGTTLPLTVYVMRLAMQSVIRAAYALAGCIAILALSGVAFSAGWMWSLAGIVLLLVVTPAVIIVIAFLGAYFPDSQFVVSNLMRIGMFLTPVFWSYEGSGGLRHFLYYWNPFTYFLEIVRAPILTGDMAAYPFLFCLASGCLIWAIALFTLGRCRRQLVFVL